MITKHQSFLKIILSASDGLDFYGFHCKFSIVVILAMAE